jgi:putative DNA primase/helicase
MTEPPDRDDENVVPFPRLAASRDRPTVELIAGRLGENVGEIHGHLIRTGVYQRSNKVVWPDLIKQKDRDGKTIFVPGICELTVHQLRTHAHNNIDFFKYNKTEKKVVPANLPLDYASALLQYGKNLELPVLTAVTTCPVLLRDGRTIQTVGYDEPTGLYYDPLGCAFPEIPARPTREQGLLGIAGLKALLAEYPFQLLSDETVEHNTAQSVVLAYWLTMICRPAFPRVPMFALNGNTARVGKGKIVAVGSILTTGSPAPVLRYTGVEEFEKGLSTCLITGANHVAIDNVEIPLESALLCSVLTEDIIRVRPFGTLKERYDIPNMVTSTVTGNKLVLVGDLAGRSLMANILSKAEDPELAKHSFDPVVVAKAGRGMLFAGGMTAVAAYVAGGCPNAPQQVGSFEEWSDVIRGALIWYGEPDPWESAKAIKAADPQRSRLRAVIEAWRGAIEAGELMLGVGVVVKRLVEAGGRYVSSTDKDVYPLADELDIIGLGAEGDNGRRIKIGTWLKANMNKVVDGYWIVRSENARDRGALWALEKTGGKIVGGPVVPVVTGSLLSYARKCTL